jgi:hypothetical protein
MDADTSVSNTDPHFIGFPGPGGVKSAKTEGGKRSQKTENSP